jgi:kumamolisin
MATVASKSYVKHKRTAAKVDLPRPAVKSYIKFPPAIGARVDSAWRVAELCQAYNLPRGTCAPGGLIGILELGGGWTQADLDQFSANNGLPKIVVEDVPVLGGSNSPGGEADAEVLLDIEVAAAVYYYATGSLPKIKVFWAPNQFESFEAVVKAAVQEGCDVLSISWGADEIRWQQAAPGAAESMEAAVVQAAQSGLAVFAAAGDNASGDGDPGANVDMPSACPHIIACGGTRKPHGGEEVVWGNGMANGEGTGGGFSNVFPMPDWQSNNGAPSGPPLNPKRNRMVPDVAADADPGTGYLVVVDGQEMTVGGTSAVAPFYAGMVAAFGPKLGFIGQTLWQNPQAFTDIVTGSNGSFSAAPGPDPCTGLGVPNGQALAAVFSTGPGTNGEMAQHGAYGGTSGSGPSHRVVQLQGQTRKSGQVGSRVSPSSYTGFALWHGNGSVIFQITDAGITADARVFVSMSEYATDARVDRFIGSAQMSVFNVAPTNGSVFIWANVNWDSALNVRFDYFVDPQQI